MVRRKPTRRSSDKDLSGAGRFTQPIGPVAPCIPPGPTIVLLNDCRDLHNYGAQALTDGLISILTTSAPSATLLPIPSHWLHDKSNDFSGMVDGGEGLRHLRATFPSVADEFETVADDWLEGRGGPDAGEFLSRFEGADLIVLNGEGSIYRTNHTAIRELFLAWLAKERLGIPTVYVNGGLHLTGVVPILPGMVRKTFRSLDGVALREAWSLRNVQEYVPGLQAALFPDTAFTLTPEDAHVSGDVARISIAWVDRPTSVSLRARCLWILAAASSPRCTR